MCIAPRFGEHQEKQQDRGPVVHRYGNAGQQADISEDQRGDPRGTPERERQSRRPPGWTCQGCRRTTRHYVSQPEERWRDDRRGEPDTDGEQHKRAQLPADQRVEAMQNAHRRKRNRRKSASQWMVQRKRTGAHHNEPGEKRCPGPYRVCVRSRVWAPHRLREERQGNRARQ